MKISRQARNAAYGRIQVGLCQKITDGKLEFFDLSQLDREKFVYSMVMRLLTNEEPEITTSEFAALWFTIYNNALAVLGSLTPTELERMFPIIKDYDGERWEMKDYFTAKAVLNKLPKDEPISDNAEMFELLWDYHNNTLREFLVKYMGCIDNIRRLNGELSTMEEFAQMNGIPTYTKFECANGKEYLRNNDTGETMRVRKPLPRHLKVVK